MSAKKSIDELHNGNSFYRRLAKDIEANGYFEMKSRLDVEELKRVDPNIQSQYNRETDMYLLTYKEG